MKYYSVFLPIINLEKGKRFQPEHAEYIQKMGQEGKVFAYGRYTDDEGELIIYIAESYEHVDSFVKRDPYVIEEACDYEIHEWEMYLNLNELVR